MQSRFKLEKSKELANWWVLTDMENLVVIRFKENEFNETQKVSLLEDGRIAKDDDKALSLARIMREMGDYMASEYPSLIASGNEENL